MNSLRSLRQSLTSADCWIAILRIGVGLWFLKSLFTKVAWSLLGGVLPIPGPSPRWAAFLPERLAEYAAGNPIGWYAGFLQHVAIPNIHAFAWLTALGESAVGLALTLGIATRWAALGGAFLMANYFLASFWMGPSQQGFHLLLFLCMAAFMGAGAGRFWGLDALWIARRARPAATVRPQPDVASAVEGSRSAS
jgi:thiosulfate dehydrogenase (quinone) large subunit